MISKFGNDEVFHIIARRGWDVLRLLRYRYQAARGYEQNGHTIQLPREALLQHDGRKDSSEHYRQARRGSNQDNVAKSYGTGVRDLAET